MDPSGDPPADHPAGDPACWAHRFEVDGLGVPPLVVQRARANGAAGQRWLDDLAGVVDAVARRWDLTVGRPYAGGTSGYVVDAIDGDGGPCVLKIAMPLDLDDHESFARSVLVHQLADGRGCARLLAHDPDAPAMLLERLGPNLADQHLPLDRLLETVASTLTAFWRPIDDRVVLPTGADQAAWLARYITTTWDELDRPCDRAVIDRALEYCERRIAAFDPTSAVLVHGDAHGWNTLDAGGGTSKFVDPEGLRSEPAHDLAAPMREYNGPLLAGDTPALVRLRAEQLAGWCDVDPEAVWEWGFIERVSTGLVSLRDFGADTGDDDRPPDDGDSGHAFLEVARRCL